MPVNDKKNIDDWLDEVTVTSRDQCDPKIVGPWWPEGFPYLVEDADRNLGLFQDETDAFRFRLDYINRKLNP